MKKAKGIFFLGAVLFGGIFLFAGCGKAKKDNVAAEQKSSFYCPMHPSFTSDKAGDCAICGMKLIKSKNVSPEASKVKDAVLSPEKTLEEVCLSYKCSMKDCPMSVKAHLKPGERLICPVCGEAISTQNQKVVEIPNERLRKQPAENKKGRKILYYRNPMNPQVTSQTPAKDNMGMDYIPVYEEEKQGQEAGVTITPERQQMIGLTSEPVKYRELKKIVRVSGRVAYDPELVVTQEEFIQALIAKDNVKDSPLQDVIDRAQDLVEAARKKLRLLGMNDEQIVSLEQTRKAQTNLYLPGKGESVWVYLAVYEYEIGFIKDGDAVDIEAVAYPGIKFTGRIASINPVLDPVTRTNQVRVEVPNPENKLKPEMFVNAVIQEKLGEKLAVPVSAVLDTGLRTVVYVMAENVLESRQVKLGQRADDYYEVLDGLKEGEVVITNGNFLVDSESRLKSPSVIQ